MYRQVLDRAAPGDVLGKTLYNERGDVLIAAGTVLSSAYIQGLRRHGVSAVYLRDGLGDDLVPSEPISERLRNRVTSTVTSMFDEIARAGRDRADGGSPANVEDAAKRLGREEKDRTAAIVERMYADVDSLIAEILAGDAVTGLDSLKSHSAYTFQHSVDVAVLGILVARRVGIEGDQMRELALGCLLHDIGKTYIDVAILDKPDKLTPAEFTEVRKHPLMGYELIRNMEMRSILPAHVSYQHHERQDGRGYPQGLTGSNRLARTSTERYDARRMLVIAEVAAVADVWSAITSDRAYRAAMANDVAAAELELMAGPHLNRDAVRELLSTVPIYPVGSWVECLGGPYGGWRGVVSEVHERTLHLPEVRLLLDARREHVPDPIVVDMRTVSEWRLACLPTGVHPAEAPVVATA